MWSYLSSQMFWRKIINVVIVWNFIKKVLKSYINRLEKVNSINNNLLLDEISNGENGDDDSDEYEVNKNDKYHTFQILMDVY